VSEADIAAAHELCPDARLRYVPNVVDVTAIEPVSFRSRASRARSSSPASPTSPTATACEFLLQEVFPRVWGPAARRTAGARRWRPTDAPSADPRVEAIGFVEDLRAAYSSARCAVVPLLAGGGTPLKFVEALAYGLPVIATPLRGQRPLDVRDGENCLLAEDGEAFAAALIRVLADGAPELGRRGRELAAERYSIEALSELLPPDRPTAAPWGRRTCVQGLAGRSEIADLRPKPLLQS